MKVAVIGTGIAGNAAAYRLSKAAGMELVVFERDKRIGGHAATATVDYDGTSIKVDTGFIVYNELNYPLFTKLLTDLGVETDESDMSFALSADGGKFEWCGQDAGFWSVVNGLFAQRSNLFSWSYLMMLREILRFQKQAREDLAARRLDGLSLGEYLQSRGFSQRLQQDYILPMGAAIWSMSMSAMLAFPALSFMQFFENHRLLQWERPKWRTVKGGSEAYVRALTAPFASSLRPGVSVRSARPAGEQIEVIDDAGHTTLFDAVIVATHAPEALALLDQADLRQREILGAIKTAPNYAYLHRDLALMPKRKAAWGSWNFLRNSINIHQPITLTYWMNRLQNLNPAKPIFVTLNPDTLPKPELTFSVTEFAHPQMTAQAVAAQQRLAEIQGQGNIWFCGAWTGYGFHEDGVRSGFEAADRVLKAFSRAGAGSE